MEIILLVITGFVLWHFIPQRHLNQPSPIFRARSLATATDPLWPSNFEKHCESPAEAAFLHAMIGAFDLKPKDGLLYGRGTRLDLQVEEGRYRVDFLANKWLVVEIDGAAYHSSEGAKARDKARDAYFESLGYSVIRIPAKVVFNAPEEAVERVRAALRTGRSTRPDPVSQSGWQRLSASATSIADNIEEANRRVHSSRAVHVGLSEAAQAFQTEKLVIETAIRAAERNLELAEQFGITALQTFKMFDPVSDPALKAAALKDWDGRTFDTMRFPAEPNWCGNAEHDAAMKSAFARLSNQRDAFFRSQRRIVASDPRLPTLVQMELKRLQFRSYWNFLQIPQETSPYPDNGARSTPVSD